MVILPKFIFVCIFRTNMKSLDKGQKGAYSSEVPEVRSSIEFLKRYKIKLEKVIRNIIGTNAPTTEVKQASSKKNQPLNNSSYLC